MSDCLNEYLGACKTVALMHAAAVGEVTGPKRGVVEDVADLAEKAKQLENEAGEIRATLLVNFGDTRHNRYGFTIKNEGSTLGLLMQVLERLAKPILDAN